MQQGQMLAHYRVEEKVGQGGMGEVYRAHDTVLGRDVALKILPVELAADQDRLQRFEREAKVLASLNHPNIAAIHGFEKSDGCTFLVMEMVEGQDLSELLKKGPLPMDEAIDIARLIAEGLEEAHEKGIIHRDLKPANIKRTSEGKVKILDFGLARAFSGQTAEEEQVGSAPTMTSPMTMTGTIMGTAAYMSPEQARGKEVDRRTDIWAFGLILFEMVSGHRLFAGETASDTLAGILKSEPEWDKLPKDLPWQVERVLRRCLAKDPRQRLRDIGEARVRLEDPDAESGLFSGPVAAMDLPPSRQRNILPWAVAAVCLATALWFGLLRSHPTPERPVMHVAIPSAEEAEFYTDGSFPSLPVVSPDGKYIVFGAKSESDKKVRLYLRALGADRAVALDGTENAQYPFWSPDSEWLGFFDRTEGLKKLMVSGGPTQTLCTATNAKGGSWSENGEIIFAPIYNSPLMVVSAQGGEPRPITSLENDTGMDSHRHPQFLPDGRHYLYFARGAGGQDSELRMASLDSDTHQVIMKLDAMAQYASGHLLFPIKGNLMAQAFDPDTGVLSGEPIPVAEDVMDLLGAAKSAFSASDEGTLIYLRGKDDVQARLVWLDRQGNEIEQVSDETSYATVSLSPDNKKAAVAIEDLQAGTREIWIVEIARDFRTRFTNNPSHDNYPVWHPSGRELFFASDRGGRMAIFKKTVGGIGDPVLVLEDTVPVVPWSFTPDGEGLFYTRVTLEGELDLWFADLTGKDLPRMLRNGPENESASSLSPDGKWLAYYSTESETGQVYLAPWPAMEPVTQVSTNSGTWHVWNRNGRELVFQENSGRYVAVSMTPDGEDMEVGVPIPLFDFTGPVADGPWMDLASDGERFLAVNSVATEPPGFCDVVVNWTAQIHQP